jgi:hypothetical protein
MVEIVVGAGVVWSRLGRAKAHLLFAAAVIGLAGCSVVDLYSDRATVYNIESEQAHDQGVLLNIVRASQRRPRAYTLVQKITGQASATGGVSVSFPFGPKITGPNTGMANASATGGPNFEVATLETHDFFAGLLAPIPPEIFALYIHAEFPRDLLFNLFIEKIVIAKNECGPANHEPSCEMVFQNYPGSELQLELFQAMVGYLIDLNLTTRQFLEPKKAADKNNKNQKDDKSETPGPSYTYVFCFAPQTPATTALAASALCGNRGPPDNDDQTKLGAVSRVGSILIHPGLAKLLDEIVRHNRELRAKSGLRPDNTTEDFDKFTNAFAGRSVSLTLYTRSTEATIYYVGEVVRRQLYPDLGAGKGFVKVKILPLVANFDVQPCPTDSPLWDEASRCTSLFILDKGETRGATSAFSINYEGEHYSIPGGPGTGSDYTSPAGASYSVLTILRQLVIYNTNAKSLPATSVLAISASP